MKIPLFVLCLFVPTAIVVAHDTWIQVDSPLVRAGDEVEAHLMLGNHGNNHRDFKLASKVSPEGWTWICRAPSGKSTDLKAAMIDTGLTPKDGYWTSAIHPTESGLHLVVQTLDKPHGTSRAIKCAKSFFLVSESLDHPGTNGMDFGKAFGAPLELVPLTDPVSDACVGRPVRVKLLYQGQPLPGSRVSFIPRGVELKEGFDDEYERKTDPEGIVEFTLRRAGPVLISAQHLVSEAQSDGFDSTKYTATLTLAVSRVPRIHSAGNRESGK